MKKWFDSPFFLNASIGFLSFLLLFLLIALFTRVIYPRIQTERTDIESHLISSVIQIEVLNGCGLPGIASRFTNNLRRSGFDVVDSGNFESFDIDYSFVIDRSGNFENARRVARALGIPETRIIREVSPHFFLDASVIIGADFNELKLQ
jgi:hypothetical protein